ncbi:leucine-rich repeat protein [Butyrivibrio sp. XPD2002]|uniref:leucine-rich repeat protein n=1 Tax=Butyrivibrio sp. XPD2002 TaxID=1280665 RepID=UPI00041ACA70|nr:leucine-rich repeat domain-containing protein [Butyrivibrio sp. XPD2002]
MKIIKEKLLLVVASVVCMIILFGCSSIHSKAASRQYSLDFSNGKTYSFDRYAPYTDKTPDSSRACRGVYNVLLYDVNMKQNESTGLWTFSKNPYQAIYSKTNPQNHAILTYIPAKNCSGIKKLEVSKALFKRCYKERYFYSDAYADKMATNDMKRIERDFEGSAKLGNSVYTIVLKFTGSSDSDFKDVPSNTKAPEPEQVPDTDEKSDKADQPEATEPSEVPAVADKKDSQTTVKASYQPGNIIKGTNCQYKVLDTKGNVAFVSVDNQTKDVTIPDTIVVDGNRELKVTDIAANAFKSNKSLKSVTVGANVTTIGDKAFYKCKKLKKITINSENLTKIGKKAFGKNSAKLKVKVPKSCKKSYKKLLKKAGVTAKVTSK